MNVDHPPVAALRSTKNLAVFRADASSGIGGGHVVRCLALATALREFGWRCLFVSCEGTTQTVPALEQSGCEIIEIPNTSSASPVALTSILTGGCGRLIVDAYNLDADYEAAIRPWTRQIIAIDDLANRNHDCDVVLDQTLNRRPDEYAALVPPSCRLLLGTDFALLRPEFSDRSRKRHSAAQQAVRKVLIAPGQTDPSHITGRAVEATQAALADAEIDIVIGQPSANLLEELESRSGSIRLHLNVSAQAMAELVSGADLAIGSGGVSSLERCVLGLPSIVIVTAENQTHVATELERSGAVVVAGSCADVSVSTLTKQISELANAPKRLSKMSERASVICDGRGVFRAIAAMVPPAQTSDGTAVLLRAAEPCDAKIMYDWQSNADTRKYARNQHMPSFRDHKNWLNEKLANPSCLFTIAEVDNVPVGLLRLDRAVEGAEISIVVEPESRGRGLGSAMLRLARALVPGETLLAYVKSGNRASISLFESAGFHSNIDGFFRQTPESA